MSASNAPNQIRSIAIVGGGAAGFFAAISVNTTTQMQRWSSLKKSAKTLAKVKVSGGGRCNVTNATYSIAELSKTILVVKNS